LLGPGTATDIEPARPRVRVLVVQDHPLLASAIAKVLASEADLTVTGVSASGQEAIRFVEAERPDVVLMDFRLPDLRRPARSRGSTRRPRSFFTARTNRRPPCWTPSTLERPPT
jgi:CheY-like chemotaxis protein